MHFVEVRRGTKHSRESSLQGGSLWVCLERGHVRELSRVRRERVRFGPGRGCLPLGDHVQGKRLRERGQCGVRMEHGLRAARQHHALLHVGWVRGQARHRRRLQGRRSGRPCMHAVRGALRLAAYLRVSPNG